MSIDLILKPSCSSCGSTVELYGSTCKHMTLCFSCGKTMAEKRAKCQECGTPVTRLIREYNIRTCSNSEKSYFIGRFPTGLPTFKKNETKWSLQKEALQGRQVPDALREKFKNKPWLLEDETGQFQYCGQLEGSQSATYYLLIRQRKEFVAFPVGSWYNFNKVAQYKQLTLEEAEEKMKNRRKAADGYERWMMKAAKNGAAAFGEIEKFDDQENAASGGKERKKATGDEDETNDLDRGDEEEESTRKNRLGLNKNGGNDDEEGPRGEDLDFDDDDIEKGDDWEHEEIFTDDDETVGNDPEEREDLAPEIPAPPEIKQDEEDEDKADEVEGGLSKSGKELKKLLGRANGLNDSDVEDDDDDNYLEANSFSFVSPVLAPKKESLKEEPVENTSPLKTTTSGAGWTPSSLKSSKGKRKINGEESKTTDGVPLKKVKTENKVKSVKDETGSTSKSSAPSKGPSTPPSEPVTEDEIRVFLSRTAPVTIQDFSSHFKYRMKSKEDNFAFMAMFKKISVVKKTKERKVVVLRER
ncbi:hypothetical protein ACJIZ3_004380 [Penstemon smallii]|uniref:Transcription initiation factor IIF subunit alpha n=1 Tax=Penstemon smallii TaxID=265156 RepID=A0ABD3S1V9_9LAMI